MKIHKYLAAAIVVSFAFWLTPNAVTKIYYSNDFDNIELFDNGTACATQYDQQVYFKPFKKMDNAMASSFFAESLCRTLRERKTMSNFYENINNRIEMWKKITNLN